MYMVGVNSLSTRRSLSPNLPCKKTNQIRRSRNVLDHAIVIGSTRFPESTLIVQRNHLVCENVAHGEIYMQPCLSHHPLMDTVLSVKFQPYVIPAIFRDSTKEGTQWRSIVAFLISRCDAKGAHRHSKT